MPQPSNFLLGKLAQNMIAYDSFQLCSNGGKVDFIKVPRVLHFNLKYLQLHTL